MDKVTKSGIDTCVRSYLMVETSVSEPHHDGIGPS